MLKINDLGIDFSPKTTIFAGENNLKTTPKQPRRPRKTPRNNWKTAENNSKTIRKPKETTLKPWRNLLKTQGKKTKTMAKKFEFIPQISTELDGLSKKEMRKYIIEYYRKNLKDLEVKNKDTGITIRFSMTSGRKTAMGEAMYQRKAEVVRILPDLVKYAIYNNFGKPKDTDGPDIIGYLNFKGRCEINGKTENLRIAVQFQKQAKFYYNVEINTIK